MKTFSKAKKDKPTPLSFPDLSSSLEQEINDQILDDAVIDSFEPDELEIINHYLVHGDQTKAFARVKQLPINTTTRGRALEFFGDKRIRDEVRRRKEIIVRNHTNLISRIIQEYQSMAFANLDDFVRWTSFNVQLKSSHELTRLQKAGIAEVKNTAHGVSIKLYDKRGVLQDLAKILQLLQDRLDLTSSDGSLSQPGTVLILPDNQRTLEQ
jgi:hypothetical protein